MRCVNFVVVAVAILAPSSVSAAFTHADESAGLSKTTSDFATNTVNGGESRKRFLRVHNPEDGELNPVHEERTKYGSLQTIISKLDEKNMKEVASILSSMKEIHGKNMLKAAKDKLTQAQYKAVIAALEEA
ncbi:RxLR effector protein [Phytophthora megakarya]|uniref:RxLR effector protein n=1 Tax=Phytophthora megakarya TaxID=4795 RepID=A0A225VLF3_9STRA|nr:RxLR effector protein [Phytophthora megakarya]